MTHATVAIPLDRLRLTVDHVQYGQDIYRTWTKKPLAAPLDGYGVTATKPGSDQQYILIYPNPKPVVLKVVG